MIILFKWGVVYLLVLMMWASHIRIIKSEYAFNEPTALLPLGGPFLFGFFRFFLS